MSTDPVSRAVGARGFRARRIAWLGVLVVALSALFSGGSVVLANDCKAFAIWTTDSEGNTVNENHYDAKTDVYLNGGPDKAGEGGGEVYYYYVATPSGTPLSEVRTVTAGSAGDFRVQLAPFADTDNPGGTYKVFVSTHADFSSQGGCTKTDNFHVGPQTSPLPSPSQSPLPSPSQSPLPSESASPLPSESASPLPSESQSPALPSPSISPLPSASPSPSQQPRQGAAIILKLDCDEDPGTKEEIIDLVFGDQEIPEGCEVAEGVEFTATIDGDPLDVEIVTDEDGITFVTGPFGAEVVLTEVPGTATEGCEPRENPITVELILGFTEPTQIRTLGEDVDISAAIAVFVNICEAVQPSPSSSEAPAVPSPSESVAPALPSRSPVDQAGVTPPATDTAMPTQGSNSGSLPLLLFGIGIATGALLLVAPPRRKRA